MKDITIRGYRVGTEAPKADRNLKMDYLHHSKPAAELLQILWTSPGRSCEGRGDEFSGDELMTDREAELACAPCPLFETCKEYAQKAHPAWGTWAGRVRGRKLAGQMEYE